VDARRPCALARLHSSPAARRTTPAPRILGAARELLRVDAQVRADGHQAAAAKQAGPLQQQRREAGRIERRQRRQQRLRGRGGARRAATSSSNAQFVARSARGPLARRTPRARLPIQSRANGCQAALHDGCTYTVSSPASTPNSSRPPCSGTSALALSLDPQSADDLVGSPRWQIGRSLRESVGARLLYFRSLIDCPITIMALCN
jgi:hypothetical protein